MTNDGNDGVGVVVDAASIEWLILEILVLVVFECMRWRDKERSHAQLLSLVVGLVKSS